VSSVVRMLEDLASYMPVGVGRLSNFPPCTVRNPRWSLGIKTGVRAGRT